MQPLREYGHLLAKVSINIIFCSVSLYGLFLQGLVQFSSAESHFLLLYVYTGMKSICEASCSDLGMFLIDRWVLFTLGGLSSAPASGIWQLGSIAQLRLWSVAVGSWLQI